MGNKFFFTKPHSHRVHQTIASFVCILFLSGCLSVYETDLVKTSDIKGSPKISVNYFDFEYMGSAGNSYNYNVGVITHTAPRKSSFAYDHLVNTLENRGVNTNAKDPEYILKCKIGNGNLDLSYVLTDSVLNFGFLSTVGLSRRENWFEMRVYKNDGSFIKSYSSEKSHCYTTIGIPFHVFGAMDKHNHTYMNLMAGYHAMNECLNNFISDFNL